MGQLFGVGTALLLLLEAYWIKTSFFMDSLLPEDSRALYERAWIGWVGTSVVFPFSAYLLALDGMNSNGEVI